MGKNKKNATWKDDLKEVEAEGISSPLAIAIAKEIMTSTIVHADKGGGISITSCGGAIVHTYSAEGDLIGTFFHSGEVRSWVQDKDKENFISMEVHVNG